jgi:DNA-binding IclR family transcriptional regulator
MASDDIKLVKSAGRVFSVLEYFDDLRRPASAVEVRKHLGLPASSASVLLRSLVALGYLSYDPGPRTYMPTLRVALLGDWIQGSTPGDRNLYQLMERLGERTGEVVVLGARTGLRAQYIRVIQATSPVRLYLKPGTVAPLTRTSVGWVLLSPLPDDQVLRIVARINAEEVDPENRVEPKWLLEQVQGVRRAGYAFCFGRTRPGVGAVGMLLPRKLGQQPIALAISGIGEAFIESKDKLVSLMRKGVKQYLQRAR